MHGYAWREMRPGDSTAEPRREHCVFNNLETLSPLPSWEKSVRKMARQIREREPDSARVRTVAPTMERALMAAVGLEQQTIARCPCRCIPCKAMRSYRVAHRIAQRRGHW